METPRDNAPGLFAALLVGLLLNTMLADTAGYAARAGLLALPLSVAVLTAAGWAFDHAWQAGQNRPLRVFFAAILVLTSAFELLRMWQLAKGLYDGAVTLTAVCVAVLLPVLYLRRVSALAQTANVLLCLLLAVTAVMALSVADRLRVVNLQVESMTPFLLWQAVRAQAVLYPEFLLPALWGPQKRGKHAALRLAAGSVAFAAAAHVLLELFFGAALPRRLNPLNTAAQSGALSVFNRLEWLQLLLWTMAVSLKLALYLYAVVRLLGGQSKGADNADGLDRFPLYLAGMLLLCVVLRGWNMAAALRLRTALTWALLALTVVTGGIKSLWAKKAGC